MGTAWLLLVGLGITGAVGALLGAAVSPDAAESVTAVRLRAFAVVGLTLPAAAIALRHGLRRPAVKRVEIALDRWPAALDGYRIVQISDIHIGSLLGREFVAWLVDRVNGLAPDLVAITGDLVDGAVKHLAAEVAPFAGLRGRQGVYFVTGNHDHYSGAESWSDEVAAMGIRVLRNEHTVIEDRGERFVLAGVDDHRSGQLPGDGGGEDLAAALSGTPSELPVVLLAHDPSTFKKAHERGIDLQLSGHTHGGQIWPFRYIVRIAVRFVAGLHQIGRATLYVSCGTGFWGPPMRLGAPAEITELILRSGSTRDGTA
jgi:predicted MPP superfamily phosphohydrolase